MIQTVTQNEVKFLIENEITKTIEQLELLYRNKYGSGHYINAINPVLELAKLGKNKQFHFELNQLVEKLINLDFIDNGIIDRVFYILQHTYKDSSDEQKAIFDNYIFKHVITSNKYKYIVRMSRELALKKTK